MFPTDPRAPKVQVGAEMPITPELLADVLHLPDGTRIIDASFDLPSCHVVLNVTHPDISSERVMALYRRDFATKEVSFVGWEKL